MRRSLAGIFSIVLWFAVIAQFVLLMQNRNTPAPEAIIRFFSFFTILTNILVALYFTKQTLARKEIDKAGLLTALTVYIFVVGIVYQFFLRHIWQPTGLQQLVDELLHSVNPVLVLCFWYAYEKKANLNYRQIVNWLIYPLVYLLSVLTRGALSGFYPYPFIDISKIGLQQTLVNAILLTLFFIVLSALFVFIGRKTGGESKA